MVVLEHLADALLEVRRGDDLAVGGGGQPRLAALALGRLGDDGEKAVARAAEEAGEDDLRLPALAVLGHDGADGGVAALVAAGGAELR